MTHPVIEQQQALNGGAVLEPDGFFDELGDAIDGTPRATAAIVLGAGLLLFLLKRAGFRFNFGVGGSIGK